MSCLNEQLAVKVMGMEWKQVYWYKDGEVAYYHHNAVDCSKPGLEHWNPTTDLNQLRECYLAAEKDWDTDKHMESFGSRFARCLSELLVPSQDSVFAFDVALITAWVKHPELVAQAILKAKGVS